MCEWGTDRVIYVIRRNHPDVPDGWHPVAVDACIADYVQRMNLQRIVTVGCCCGHGKAPSVVLVDSESAPLLDHYGYSYTPFDNRTDTLEHIIPEDHRRHMNHNEHTIALAQTAYAAWRQRWLQTGLVMPTWDIMTDVAREPWIAAINATCSSLIQLPADQFTSVAALSQYPIEPSPNIDLREVIRVNDALTLVRTVGTDGFSVMLDGLEVPRLSLYLSADGTWHVSLSPSFGFDLGQQSPETLYQMLLLVANSMAVAAGFSGFGEHSSPINPYKKYPGPHRVEIASIDAVAPNGASR